MPRLLIIFLLLYPTLTLAESTETEAGSTSNIRVVVSIKPIHSLVASIMQGVATPGLLMSSSQTPHHYSLRPSERTMLAEANLVIWVGPQLEHFMERIIGNEQNSTRVITLLDAKGLITLPVRAISAAERQHQTEHDRIDAHIWLNTHNIDAMIEAITGELTAIDPAHRLIYLKNKQNLLEQTSQLRTRLAKLLKNSTQSFLTYHDAYQYFEYEFDLNNAGTVSIDEDVRPGAKHIHDLKKTIHQKSIQCIFYSAPNRPSIIDSLISGSITRAVELDPAGIRPITTGHNGDTSNLLIDIMQSMGTKIHDCLEKK